MWRQFRTENEILNKLLDVQDVQPPQADVWNHWKRNQAFRVQFISFSERFQNNDCPTANRLKMPLCSVPPSLDQRYQDGEFGHRYKIPSMENFVISQWFWVISSSDIPMICRHNLPAALINSDLLSQYLNAIWYHPTHGLHTAAIYDPLQWMLYIIAFIEVSNRKNNSIWSSSMPEKNARIQCRIKINRATYNKKRRSIFCLTPPCIAENAVNLQEKRTITPHRK
jgi:hypothetical protein